MITTTALALAFAVSLSALIRRRPFAERLLIVGTTPLAGKLVAELEARGGGIHRLAGIVDDGADTAELPLRNRLIGPLGRLAEIINEVQPDRIVVALADRRGRLPVRELLRARVQGVAVEDGVHFYERLTGKVAIESLTPSHLISSPDFRKTHADLAFGHALSLVVSFIALVLLAPVFALVALAIRLDSPGPAVFVQDRVGARGRRFPLMKFRTMRPAERSKSEWARDNGDRITRVGKWLRRYRLDELPQLVNVLRGEMNLVGPRPHPMSNFDLFTEQIPYYWLRSVVRPGLTGWAQVRQGYANGLEEETEKMRYDLYYIKHMSAWLDLRILCETVRSVLAGRDSATPGDLALRLPPARGLQFEPLPFLPTRRTLAPQPVLVASTQSTTTPADQVTRKIGG